MRRGRKKSGCSPDESTCSEYFLLISQLTFHVGTRETRVYLLLQLDRRLFFVRTSLSAPPVPWLMWLLGRSGALPQKTLAIPPRHLCLDNRAAFASPIPSLSGVTLATMEQTAHKRNWKRRNTGRSDRSLAEQISPATHGGREIRYGVFELKNCE